jgi:DNA-binding NtrC family response regulator
VVLGRGETVFDRPFDDPAMAPHHAEICLQGNGAVLHDFGSQEETRLNGVPMKETLPLQDGDVIRLGNTLIMYTHRERVPSSSDARLAEELALTGATPSIEAVRRSIEAVAPFPRTVVISGETGTGKEIVAHLIHRRSGRTGPFLAVNCGGFTEGLLASELFGHVRGAFTGAVTEQQGLFKAARGGTLFLDEVGEIPLALQPTLLRVLETWMVRPVGSSHEVAIDVRVIAASNRELVGLVQRGLFRADLYARLAQWFIRLPPLRDRRGDIPALARALLKEFDVADRQLSPDLAEAILVHSWPLNVRGLSNVLSIATITSPEGERIGMSEEVIAALEDNRLDALTAIDLPPAALAVRVDRAGLEELLLRFGGRVAEMARHVGVSRPKLYRMLWAVRLDPALYRGRPEERS